MKVQLQYSRDQERRARWAHFVGVVLSLALVGVSIVLTQHMWTRYSHYNREALYNSVTAGDATAAESALEMSRRMGSRDDGRERALLGAISSNRVNMVRWLLGQDADPNTSEGGWPALHVAVGVGNTEVVDLLLKHGARVNAYDIRGRTALMNAAATGDNPVVSMLLEHGADATLTDPAGHHAASLATDGGHAKTVQLLRPHIAHVQM